MDKRTTEIVAYLTWVGLFIAILAGDREGAKFHINQALVIMLFAILGIIPCVGWIWAFIVLALWIMGLISAINGEEKEIPILGKIKIIK